MGGLALLRVLLLCWRCCCCRSGFGPLGTTLAYLVCAYQVFVNMPEPPNTPVQPYAEVSLGLCRSCSSLRYKALICCAASLRLVVLVRVASKFDPWMQSLICCLYRGACLSPVSLTLNFRLSLQPQKLQWTREALGGLCRYCPVIAFTVIPMGHSTDLPTPLEDPNLENIFKFTCLVSALGMQSLEIGIALF